MRKYLIALLVLTSAGLLFSGYLSTVKLFTNACALGQTCPLFLGYPACYFGFAMYLAMWFVTLGVLLGGIAVRKALAINAIISFVGILFAGRFFVDELLHSKVTGSLGLSSCTYGLIVYIAIFAISILATQIQNIAPSRSDEQD